MRGKHVPLVDCTAKTWITPADAGKTSKYEKEHSDFEDHPRGCGENCSAHTLSMLPSGSPPRMRGKRNILPPKSLTVRITPADAGKTRKEKTAAFEKQDHPRGCGENTSAEVDANERAGSPPRMRGKQKGLKT